jgi:hypothetical protein
MSVPERPLAEETLTDGDLAELDRKLEIDSMLRRRFDADPVAAAEAVGMHDLALGLAREIRELVGLAERIANDDAYRADAARGLRFRHDSPSPFGVRATRRSE